MRRHELTDTEWDLIRHLFPTSRRRGGQWQDHRTILSGMFWRMRTGTPWRDIPERYGKWKTIYHRFNAWRKDGTFDKIMECLQIKLDKNGLVDWDLWCVDGSSIRASRSAAGAGKKGAPKSPPTTRWVAREAATEARSIWLLTAREFPSPSMSPQAKSTNRHSSKKP